jgi:hypothetical protein
MSSDGIADVLEAGGGRVDDSVLLRPLHGNRATGLLSTPFSSSAIEMYFQVGVIKT